MCVWFCGKNSRIKISVREGQKLIAIAIDGPAGSGKSSIADVVAKKFGYLHIDTGALYRAVAYYFLRNKINYEDEEKVGECLRKIKIDILSDKGIQKTVLNGKILGEELRTIEVSKAAAKVAGYNSVRNFLLKIQRECAESNNVVMDGRDIGTVILPNADVKIFLTASSEERAERRLRQNVKLGRQDSYEEILKVINKRDEEDINRAISPLKKAEDAVLIDSTEYSFMRTVEKITEVIKEKIG